MVESGPYQDCRMAQLRSLLDLRKDKPVWLTDQSGKGATVDPGFVERLRSRMAFALYEEVAGSMYRDEALQLLIAYREKTSVLVKK